MKKYYEAYDERYKTAHRKGVSWSSDKNTPIVLEVIDRYLNKDTAMLEIGCGEGRDARAVLEKDYDLLATDISSEAIDYCRRIMPEYSDRFMILDGINGYHPYKYDFIYSVAVIHMLVEDEDRKAFYRFIHNHLTDTGLALFCTIFLSYRDGSCMRIAVLNYYGR